MSVTVLGLGQMGTALADAFLAAGHPTTVWNRSAGKADGPVARGAALAGGAAEAVAASPLVVVCLSTYDVVREVLADSAGTLRGRTLVNLTSGSPEQARETADWAAGHGIDYVDGAIMSTPPGIGNSAIMLLYSGSPAAFAAHEGTLRSLGDAVHLGDDAGTASLYDTALLGMMWATLGGWLQGVALTGADGIAATAFTPVAVRWLTAVSGFMSTYAPQIDAGAYPGDDATLDVHLASVEHLVHASAARGLDVELPGLFKAFMEQGIAAGYGGDSYARLIDVVRNGGRA
ncbi:NAD(P)-dependent oxidoreductase [Streptomyces albireticuli]|uniref:6-phosphogluconate dehydrogenase n=1 Tax=Streptomyces albireticuli TaxID=1940 RepID=A0A2A2CY55_9ACTN|nr:NAD(P)-binding domain-containing protein [Streptomyces albireticuli]MCD9142414.1 NAD(P)-binding domain-containing protein [Streptomyces albireticuli]MCD9166059.1 NAD(P)-binding domain-containing protein [Streptomyces albireticuli]MCD9192542.1 NAD(P)-binding domain-containing protein [Streptomyces albireticuli]PAU44164.1 6-phosphogluconate dehydrogenase [Streptomyces albireticuli]